MGRRGSQNLKAMIGAIAFSIALSPIAPASSEEPSPDFEKAVMAFDRGDFPTAYNNWLPLAEAGDLAAQRNVALLLRKGLGTERDPKRAFDFYKSSADKGLVSSQANVALLYEQGIGVPQSDKNAAHYFARAAKAGHANAQYHLALMATEGRGMEKNSDLAHSLMKAAAAQEHSLAIEAVQELEARKQPVRIGAAGGPESGSRTLRLHKTEAAFDLPLSAELRTQMSPLQLAGFEEALGEFTSGERGEALDSLRRLSLQGVGDASFRAGLAYLYGAGAPQDLNNAFAFLQLANTAHHPDAPEMMKKVLMEMHRQALDQMDPD